MRIFEPLLVHERRFYFNSLSRWYCTNAGHTSLDRLGLEVEGEALILESETLWDTKIKRCKDIRGKHSATHAPADAELLFFLASYWFPGR